MSKKAKGIANNRSIKQFLKSTAPPPVSQSSEAPMQLTTPTTEKRKIVGNLESFIIKKPSSKPVVASTILHFPRDLIEKLNPDQLFQEVPSLKAFAQALQQRTIHKICVRKLIWSFLSHRKNQLWSLKYAPNDLLGVFPVSTVDRIRKWLKQFSWNMSDIDMSDADFICDSGNQHEQNRRSRLKSCSQKALILYGREGIGKMTLLKCIAETMGMEPHVCSNEQDRFKYLKQKDESTKSECVKNRKRCPTPSVLLTSFFPKKEDQSNSQTQPQSVQIIHQINLIFPSDKKTKFHQDLIRLMQQSMVPFIFTSSVQSIPAEYKQFEKMEYKELNRKELAELFWLVYHIQWAMSELYTNQGIEKEQLFGTLNKELAQVKFQEVIKVKEFEDIVQILDFKLDAVFNILQFHFLLRTRDPQTIKKQALRNIIHSAENANYDKIVQNIPSQHFKNNLNEIYSINRAEKINMQDRIEQALEDKLDSTTEDIQQALQDRLTQLNSLMIQDQLAHVGDDKTINCFYRRNWLEATEPDFSQVDVKQHYLIPQHKSLKTMLSNRLNSSVVSSYQMHSTFKPADFPLLRPERTRTQRRQTRQLLQQIVGTDYARYLTYFSTLG